MILDLLFLIFAPLWLASINYGRVKATRPQGQLFASPVAEIAGIPVCSLFVQTHFQVLSFVKQIGHTLLRFVAFLVLDSCSEDIPYSLSLPGFLLFSCRQTLMDSLRNSHFGSVGGTTHNQSP